MAVTYEPIATTTLTGNQADVTFSSITGTYTDLVLVVSASFTSSSDIRYRANGDSGSNYSFNTLHGDGTSSGAIRGNNNTSGLLDYYGAIGTTNGTSTQIITFFNYSNTTTYKTSISRANNAGVGVDAIVNLYRSNTAITSLVFARGSAFGGTWQTGSTFTLYGIKAA